MVCAPGYLSCWCESDPLFSQDPPGVPVHMLVPMGLVTRLRSSSKSPRPRVNNSWRSSPRSTSEYSD